MPKKFRFHGPNQDFECNLASERCVATTKTGNQCSRKCVIGVNYCYTHLLHEKHLKIKNTNHGKGLFAIDTKKARNAVIFKGTKKRRNRFGVTATTSGDKIIEYKGEEINQNILDSRYGMYTAPYAIQNEQKRGVFEDGACRRGIGSIANHPDRGQKANATFHKGNNIVMRAKTNIKNGDEILVNYNAGNRQQNQYIMHEPGVTHSTR